MNTITLSITTMALGVMVGITGTHYQQVNKMVEQGGAIQIAPSVSPRAPEVPQGPQETIPVRQIDLAQQPVTPMRLAISDVPDSQPPATSEVGGREDAMLEILMEMRREQKSMRRQMAETNREVDELSFQVDTHSDSFKPLRATDDNRPRVKVQPIDDTGGLLPPKP